MIFADASALIAVISREDDAPFLSALSARIEADEKRLCSALSTWETMSGLCRSYGFPTSTARSYVRDFLQAFEFQFVSIGPIEADIAADAYARFGKGRHPAALNMGDCFSYACAKTNNAKLLYKGNDFARTDLA